MKSICLYCFETVATACSETDLVEAEERHKCWQRQEALTQTKPVTLLSSPAGSPAHRSMHWRNMVDDHNGFGSWF
ncbi:hypothetical protein ACPOL_6863 (plasmid) [Acidisarcina polymorpha]|uniref:Uncharacterized protein n=1 Tax=Acidisarcina polymorpha TaxID=2211140 RepID=A0A2Z5GAA8_9BACT|nr:hypothetical protein ACPOL_6863 [Acidisarcina polymorpha]